MGAFETGRRAPSGPGGRLAAQSSFAILYGMRTKAKGTNQPPMAQAGERVTASRSSTRALWWTRWNQLTKRTAVMISSGISMRPASAIKVSGRVPPSSVPASG